LDTVRQQIEQAWCGEPQKYRLDEISVRLAKMPLEKFAAEIPKWQEYFGLNKQQLTEEVARTRGQNEQGNPSALSQLEPWPDPVDGAELLNQLVSECCRFLVLPDHGDVMLAAWTLHTYCFEQFDYSPILHVTSPTKQCAKSRVLEVLAKLAHNPKSSSNMTAATMFRTIETRKPTLLLDEMDRSPKDKKEMITIVLNAGFHRDGKVDRCEGDEHKVKTFGVYCPKALAGIGDYTTDTVTDRSIQLSMQKKLKSQEVEKFRRYQNEELQRKCVRWAKDNLDMLASSRPQMPNTLSDRQEDIWECLFAIAEIAGGEWPQKVWDAASAQAADSVAQVTDDLVLLAAIRQRFVEIPSHKEASSVICEWLNFQDDLPFKDWRRGQGIDPRFLGRKLKPYGITPRNLNLGGSSRLKGYLLEELEPVFQRYLPPDNPPIQPLPATTPEKAGRNEDSHPLPDDTVADETPPNSANNGHSSGVADGERVCPAVQEEPAYVEEF
jgi:putative DNA primase/helicase